MTAELKAIKTYLDRCSEETKSMIIIRATEWGITPPMVVARILDEQSKRSQPAEEAA